MAEKKSVKNNNSNKPFVDSVDLPHSYNQTKLTLIARDPYWAYAYWEIAPSSIEDIRQQIRQEIDRAVYALRVYDVSYIDFNGSNANRQFDIDVGSSANNWYINLWNDSASFCADLGLRCPDGRFFRLARSNFVTTPRANPSNRSEEIWMKREADKSGQPYVFGGVQRRANTAPARNYRTFNHRRMSLSEDDIRVYYSRLSPLLKDIISARLAHRYAKKSNPGPLNVVLKGGSRHNFLTGKFTKKMLGASEETISGASESLPGGASEQIRNRKFFFELNTELIVYGRTEPDATVLFGDKRISLRSDGTFSLRFALPDGKIPLPFTAISTDEVEKREISTKVEREKTRYA